MLLKPNMTILFQGDSITDAGRIRELPDSLGDGYPHFAAAKLQTLLPNYHLKFINRGVSGDTSTQMLARWQEDCLDLKPDMLSILIGINDTWRRYDASNTPTSAEKYEENYRSALTQVREACGDIPILLLEPFLIPFFADKEHWRGEDLDARLQVVRKLAKEFNAYYLPLDGMFAQKAIQSEPTLWSGDGVHPTPAGHYLIAEQWVKTVLEN